jgi:hypothetical protein
MLEKSSVSWLRRALITLTTIIINAIIMI